MGGDGVEWGVDSGYIFPDRMPTRPASTASAYSQRSTRRGLPALGLLAMLMQLLVLLGAPVLDARVEHVGEVAVHIEDAQDPSCPQAHLADDCGLCQLQAASRLALGRVVPAPAAVLRRALAPHGDAAVAVSSAAVSHLGSRAPPRG